MMIYKVSIKAESLNSDKQTGFILPIAMFIIAYSAFLVAQYIAILIIAAFSEELSSGDIRKGFLEPLWRDPELGIAILSTLITYVVIYRREFIKKERYKTGDAKDQITNPVKEIIIIQITVLAGGFISILISRFISFDVFVFKGIMIGSLLLLKNLADIGLYRKRNLVKI